MGTLRARNRTEVIPMGFLHVKGIGGLSRSSLAEVQGVNKGEEGRLSGESMLSRASVGKVGATVAARMWAPYVGGPGRSWG